MYVFVPCTNNSCYESKDDSYEAVGDEHNGSCAYYILVIMQTLV